MYAVQSKRLPGIESLSRSWLQKCFVSCFDSMLNFRSVESSMDWKEQRTSQKTHTDRLSQSSRATS
jgi:hypothetical protein